MKMKFQILQPKQKCIHNGVIKVAYTFFLNYCMSMIHMQLRVF
jgi:hypothetical protein